MNSLGVLSAHPVSHRLAVVLLEFVWQGALVCLLWAAARAMLTRARPSARYALGCAALLAMVVFPCWTFWQLSGEGSRPLAPTLVESSAHVGKAMPSADSSSPPTAPDSSRGSIALPRALLALPQSIEPWPVVIWAAGVLFLCLRFLTGWAALGRLKRGARTQASPALRENLGRIARRMRISRPVRLLESAAIRVPAALGVLRPAILLPLSGLCGLSPAQIEALLAHELAHVKRNDYLVNLLQTAVETLLFYHPAVWWISGQVRLEREQCCDDLAIEATGDARAYARALLRLEEQRAIPQLAVAANGAALLPRIARLFPRHPDNRTHPAHAGAFLALAALVILGAAARCPVSQPDILAASLSLPVSTTVEVMEASLGIGDDPAPPPAARPARASLAHAAEVRAQTSVAAPARSARAGAVTSEELEDFRTHGVTADFIREIEALGYTHASASTLISLRVHGVSPDFLRGINEVFAERISLDTAVELRTHGVGADYVKEMSAVFGKLSPDTAESLRIHGVSPEYAARFRQQGYGSLSADQAITLRNHGVDPGAAGELVKLGFSKPSLDELVALRNHGVSVEYARSIRDAGLAVLDLDEMVSLRSHGVTSEYLKAMGTVGFPRLSPDEAIALRNHGVTSEYLGEMHGAGYGGLSVHQAVSLRKYGVTATVARKANASAGKHLSVEELLDDRSWKRRNP